MSNVSAGIRTLYCKKSVTGIMAKSRYRGWLSRSPTEEIVHRGLWRGVAVRRRPYRATAAHPSCPSRDRDIGGAYPLSLAGSHGREEDRSTSIKTKLEETHAKQGPDRSDSASEMRDKRDSRRGRDRSDRQRGDLSRRVRQARPVQGRSDDRRQRVLDRLHDQGD